MAFDNISKEMKWVICIAVIIGGALIGWYVGNMNENSMLGAVAGAVIGVVVVIGLCWALEIKLTDDDVKMTY